MACISNEQPLETSLSSSSFFRIQNINGNPLTDVGGIKKGKTFIMDKRIFFF
jgi:hypothetical protein